VMPAGSRSIRHPSLGHVVKGGRIAIDPTDSKQQKTINPQWEMTLRFQRSDLSQTREDHHWFPPEERLNNNGENEAATSTRTGAVALPGTRVKVRFTLESRPLAVQWWRTFRQAFMTRFAM